MSQGSISTWLKFALQQMAAESYLDQILLGRPLREILLDGNNDTRFVAPDANGDLPGMTRFTNALVIVHAILWGRMQKSRMPALRLPNLSA